MTCPMTPEVLKFERDERLQASHTRSVAARLRRRSGVALDPSLELFEGLGKRELKRLAKHFAVVSVAAGTKIGKIGEPCREFTVVLEGQVAIGLDGLALGVIPPGCFFGAVSMLDEHDDSRRGAPMALEPSVLAIANRQEFRSIMRDFPIVSERIAEVASRRRAGLDRMAAEHEKARSELSIDFPIHVSSELASTTTS